MIRYRIEIAETLPDPEGVRVYWRLTGRDGTAEQSAQGSVLLPGGLTERQIRNRVRKAPIVDEYKARIAAALAG